MSLARSRDLFAASLACDLGPGKPDAAAVLSLGTITEDHLRQRLAACPVHAGELVAALRREARGRGAG